MPLSGTVYCL